MKKGFKEKLEEEIELAFGYLAKWRSTHRYYEDVRNHLEATNQKLAGGVLTSLLDPTEYAWLLGAIVYTLNRRPRKNETYEERLNRVLKNKNIVEIGARHGIFVDFLNKHGALATGVDSNQDAVEIAKKFNISVKAKNVQDIEAEECDLIVSHGFFEPTWWSQRYREQVPRIVKTVAGALKKGGHSIHTVAGFDNEITVKNIQDAGLKEVFHNTTHFGGDVHVSIAKR